MKYGKKGAKKTFEWLNFFNDLEGILIAIIIVVALGYWLISSLLP
jgi:hypothetical protein